MSEYTEREIAWATEKLKKERWESARKLRNAAFSPTDYPERKRMREVQIHKKSAVYKFLKKHHVPLSPAHIDITGFRTFSTSLFKRGGHLLLRSFLIYTNEKSGCTCIYIGAGGKCVASAEAKGNYIYMEGYDSTIKKYRAPSEMDARYYADILVHLGRVSELDDYLNCVAYPKEENPVPKHYFDVPDSYQPDEPDDPRARAAKSLGIRLYPKADADANVRLDISSLEADDNDKK